MGKVNVGVSLYCCYTLHFISDYANRGMKKFGDKCEVTQECGFPGSICDSKKRSCQCIEELPVTNHIDKCGKGNVTIRVWHCLSTFM